MKAFVTCAFVALIFGLFAAAMSLPRPQASCDATGAIAAAVAGHKRGC